MSIASSLDQPTGAVRSPSRVLRSESWSRIIIFSCRWDVGPTMLQARCLVWSISVCDSAGCGNVRCRARARASPRTRHPPNHLLHTTAFAIWWSRDAAPVRACLASSLAIGAACHWLSSRMQMRRAKMLYFFFRPVPATRSVILLSKSVEERDPRYKVK